MQQLVPQTRLTRGFAMESYTAHIINIHNIIDPVSQSSLETYANGRGDVCGGNGEDLIPEVTFANKICRTQVLSHKTLRRISGSG